MSAEVLKTFINDYVWHPGSAAPYSTGTSLCHKKGRNALSYRGPKCLSTLPPSSRFPGPSSLRVNELPAPISISENLKNLNVMVRSVNAGDPRPSERFFPLLLIAILQDTLVVGLGLDIAEQVL